MPSHKLTDVGRAALSDTRDIVALLRDSSAGDPSDAVGSAVHVDMPGIDQVPGLVDRVRESGVNVTLRQEEELPDLTPQASHAAYRVVQEGLTNVIRHAAKAATDVTLTRSVNDVIIEVADQGSRPSRRSTGRRQRV